MTLSIRSRSTVTALADLEAILLHVAGDAAIRPTLSQPHDCGSFMKKQL
jgi:hypothetical protein